MLPGKSATKSVAPTNRRDRGAPHRRGTPRRADGRDVGQSGDRARGREHRLELLVGPRQEEGRADRDHVPQRVADREGLRVPADELDEPHEAPELDDDSKGEEQAEPDEALLPAQTRAELTYFLFDLLRDRLPAGLPREERPRRLEHGTMGAAPSSSWSSLSSCSHSRKAANMRVLNFNISRSANRLPSWPFE